MQVDLDHCVIHVSNWECSNAFYQNVLGAEVIPRGNGFAYRLGNAQLKGHGTSVYFRDPDGSLLEFISYSV